MNLSKKIIELKEDVEQSRNELMRLEGKKEELGKMLDKELNKYKIDRKDVKEFLEDLKIKIENTKKEIEEGIEELEELLCL